MITADGIYITFSNLTSEHPFNNVIVDNEQIYMEDIKEFQINKWKKVDIKYFVIENARIKNIEIKNLPKAEKLILKRWLRLEKITVNNLPKMDTTELVNLPKLKELNLTNLPNLRIIKLEDLPKLKEITIDNLPQLEKIELPLDQDFFPKIDDKIIITDDKFLERNGKIKETKDLKLKMYDKITELIKDFIEKRIDLESMAELKKWIKFTPKMARNVIDNIKTTDKKQEQKKEELQELFEVKTKEGFRIEL